jgi:hypothetical protein
MISSRYALLIHCLIHITNSLTQVVLERPRY